MTLAALDGPPYPADAANLPWLRELNIGGRAGGLREPHRHDHHELIWIAGAGQHTLDGQPVAVRPGTVS
jgi:quercetin dioxygenase-like cupin family protein